MTRGRAYLIAGLVALLVIAAAALVFATGSPAAKPAAQQKTLVVLGAENEYANVLAQVGGRYVRAIGIMSNPSTDPHTYEASTTNAREVAQASLVVQNGLGYDSFMQKLEANAPSTRRIILTVASIVGAPPSTENPHLWYRPSTMPAVAQSVAKALSQLEPQHKSYFARRAAAFDRSLGPWRQALAKLRQDFHGAKVVVTEPVADYLLQAAGLDVATPWSFQAAVMNGQDPSPQDVSTVDSLISTRQAKVLVYNLQAVEPTTESLLAIAKAHQVPVVGVNETMPAGFDYQHWMLAETQALTAAIGQHKSEVHLK